MNKKTKATFLISVVLLVWWAALFFTNTKAQPINYWWQVGMGAAAIIFGIFGLATAKKWNWLKSGIGKGTFLISLGVIVWGIGQALWTYFVIKNPGVEAPDNRIIDIFYFSSIPLWIYGIILLSRATGAKYGLKKPLAKAGVVVLSVVMLAISYYLLVIVARGGNSYFEDAAFWDVFFDLGYAAGDAVNLLLVLAIFGLSWKLLGGMFKKPILIILFSFAAIYLADTFYSYQNAQEIYYNGNIADLFYMLTIATFGIGLSMLDPSRSAASTAVTAEPTVSPLQPATQATNSEAAIPLPQANSVIAPAQSQPTSTSTEPTPQTDSAEPNQEGQN